MKEFENKITELNEDETFQSAMTYEEDQKFILNTEKRLAFEEGVEKGISSGIEQRTKEVAKTLLSMGMSLEDISKATNLSIDQINKLK